MASILSSFDNYTKLQEKALEASRIRNDAIITNIANSNTPNYKRKTVKFEELLQDAMDSSSIKGKTTHPRHIPIGVNSIDDVSILVSEDYKENAMRLDGNNVDIDNEMALLAENDIRYNVLTQNISSKFAKLKSAINEGR